MQQCQDRNGKQKDFGMGQKGQRAISEVRNVPVPGAGPSVQRIGDEEGEPTFGQYQREGEELDHVFGATPWNYQSIL